MRVQAQQAELTFGVQTHIEGLRGVGEVGQVQRQPGLVAARHETRRSQLGHQRCGDHGGGLCHAVAVVGPGLRHQAQLAVEIGNVDADFAFALLVQGHGGALQRDDGHAGGRALAAFGQRRVTAERHAGQTALPGFDQLPVNIQLVSTIGLAPKQAGVRVGCRVVGDIEYTHVHRRQQHMGLFGDAAVCVFGVDLDRQRLLGAHLLRGIQRQRQLAL